MNIEYEKALQEKAKTDMKIEKAFDRLIERCGEKTPTVFINGEDRKGFDPGANTIHKMW